jgi:hypothetical protein
MGEIDPVAGAVSSLTKYARYIKYGKIWVWF